jgi:hypothetical protein
MPTASGRPREVRESSSVRAAGAAAARRSIALFYVGLFAQWYLIWWLF